MLSSLEALDDPPKPTSVPRASVFQPKAKPRARKQSNNVPNSSNKTKANAVEAPPGEPAKVPKCETGTILGEVAVSVPVSPPQTSGEPSDFRWSTGVHNPAGETSILEFSSIKEPVVTEVAPISLPAHEESPQLEGLGPLHTAGSQASDLEFLSIQEPGVTEVVPNSLPVQDENPQLEGLVPLHTAGSFEHLTQDNGELYAAPDATDVSPVPCPATQKAAGVAEDEKPKIELRRSKRKAVINRHFGNTAQPFGEEDDETKLSHLSRKRNKERERQQSQNNGCEPKTKLENKDEVRKDAQDCKGTQQKVSEEIENISIPNARESPEAGADLANNLDMKTYNLSRSRRPKMSLRKLSHDCTIMQQGILENTENASISNTENRPEEGVASGDPEETNNQSICQRDKMRVRKRMHDSAIMQQEIRGNVYVSNTENPLVDGLVPVSNINDKNNKTFEHHREKMNRMKSAHDPLIMEEEYLESGENLPVPNTEDVMADGLGPANEVGNKSNNQYRHRGQKMEVSKAANGSTLKEQDFLDSRENISGSNTEILPAECLAPTNDSDNKNINQLRRQKQKAKARKSASDSTMLQQDFFENRDDAFVPGTGNPPGKGVAPLKRVDGKNNNQSRSRKRKSKSSTENMGHDDLSPGIHGTDLQLKGNLKVAMTEERQPFEDTETNKNVATKQQQKKKTKKQASKSGELSLEGSKKKFSHSTRRHKRRVEKHLLETPEADLDHSKLTMRDIIWLAEAKERRLNKEKAAKKKSCVMETTQNSISKETPKVVEEDEGISLAPQVHVINGQIVINEQSLLVSARELNTDDVRTYRRVEESTSKLNYHSYMNRTPVERWSKSDTELFYKAMRQFGADFTMIQHLFPGRTRSQVKAKYKREERYHPLRLADTLIYRPQDHSHYQMLIDQLKIPPGAAEHDCVRGEHAGPSSSEDLLIERLDEDHGGRGVDIHQINRTVDSPPKTPESDTSEQMHAHEKDSVNNCEEPSHRYERNTGSATLLDQNMKDSDVDEQASLHQEKASDDEPSTKPVTSLFSYQTAPPKPVISLFSYQQA